MHIVDPSRYVFVGFEPARAATKKYAALLRERASGRIRRVPFGDRRYEQYKDRTGLGLYSHLDHGDAGRRRNYHTRHAGNSGSRFSSGWFAAKYLW